MYGLAALGCMYGTITSFNHAWNLQEVINERGDNPRVQRVKELYSEFDERSNVSRLHLKDYKGLAKVCLELDSLKQEGAFEQIRTQNKIQGNIVAYAAATTLSGFASLVLAGL